jgi:prepilin-type N-terminal cleavage/methylation domain-containing protein
MSRRIRRARGVTLIELIVGILLVCITLTLVLPFIDRVRGKAQSQGAVNNMRKVGQAMHNYHDVYRSFPSPPKGKK